MLLDAQRRLTQFMVVASSTELALIFLHLAVHHVRHTSAALFSGQHDGTAILPLDRSPIWCQDQQTTKAAIHHASSLYQILQPHHNTLYNTFQVKVCQETR